jgi:hypothetical protein
MRVRAILTACPAVILLAVTPPDVTLPGAALPGVLAPAVAARADETSCAAPLVTVAPQPGGQQQFRIQSPCRKGQLVIGRYGEIVVMDRLDPDGNLALPIDCFLGDREITFTFADDRRAASRACAAVESTLTKIAIVWQDHVDLDLHAFEYSALPGSTGDRSAGNPGSYQAAQSEYTQSSRSHGFMSSVSDGQQMGHNVEVYTLLRHPAEGRGLIAMAVGPGANYRAAAPESCSNGRRELRVDLDVYVLDPGMKPRSYARTFAAPCDGVAPRIVTNLVPNILLGSAGGDANEQ